VLKKKLLYNYAEKKKQKRPCYQKCFLTILTLVEARFYARLREVKKKKKIGHEIL